MRETVSNVAVRSALHPAARYGPKFQSVFQLLI